MDVRRLTAFALFIVSLVAMLAACQSSLETRRGGPGDFCNNRDSDCRQGLICQDSVCVFQNPEAQNACPSVCAKLEQCAIEEANCLANCGLTIEDWGETQVETWTTCLVEDKTCEDLGTNSRQAAQTCYDELPLPEERDARCQSFINELAQCAPDVNTQNLRKECIEAAKTLDDETWSNTESCVEAADFGTCGELIDCLNTVFQPSQSDYPLDAN